MITITKVIIFIGILLKRTFLYLLEYFNHHPFLPHTHTHTHKHAFRIGTKLNSCQMHLLIITIISELLTALFLYYTFIFTVSYYCY